MPFCSLMNIFFPPRSVLNRARMHHTEIRRKILFRRDYTHTHTHTHTHNENRADSRFSQINAQHTARFGPRRTQKKRPHGTEPCRRFVFRFTDISRGDRSKLRGRQTSGTRCRRSCRTTFSSSAHSGHCPSASPDRQSPCRY